MATYLVILTDDQGNENWHYPTEIEATDKNDAFNAICENVSKDTISAILTPSEYKTMLSQKNSRYKMQANNLNENYESSTDFFKNIFDEAMHISETPNNIQNTTQINIENTAHINNQNNISIPVKFFEDNGIFFKLENNILYKKCWETILPENNEDKSEQYRIINIDTNKIINNPKYAIQKLNWKEIKN